MNDCQKKNLQCIEKLKKKKLVLFIVYISIAFGIVEYKIASLRNSTICNIIIIHTTAAALQRISFFFRFPRQFSRLRRRRRRKIKKKPIVFIRNGTDVLTLYTVNRL